MLKLTSQEQAWLDSYRETLEEQRPETVEQMFIYGSNARGQFRAESDPGVKDLRDYLRKPGSGGYWDELLEGKYEWSSLGMQLWQKGMVK